MPKLIYVTGPVRNRTTDQLEEFAIARERLEALGYEVTTAIDDLPVGNKASYDPALKEYFKRRMHNLLSADLVLCLMQFECEGLSNSEAHTARRNGRPVKLVVDFLEDQKKLRAA